MSNQLTNVDENELVIMNNEKRGLFVKTAKSLNQIGIILLWLCVVLMSAALISVSNMVSLVCFVAFAFSYLFYLAAERNGGIFEYIPVKKNNGGRQLIFFFGVLVDVAGLIYLAFFDASASSLIVSTMLFVSMTAVTALRFVGLQK